MTKAEQRMMRRLTAHAARRAFASRARPGLSHRTPPAGTYALSAGEHRLAVEIVGANPQAIKQYMFGLDEVLLEPAP